jgi:hypothetical protein
MAKKIIPDELLILQEHTDPWLYGEAPEGQEW